MLVVAMYIYEILFLNQQINYIYICCFTLMTCYNFIYLFKCVVFVKLFHGVFKVANKSRKLCFEKKKKRWCRTFYS